MEFVQVGGNEEVDIDEVKRATRLIMDVLNLNRVPKPAGAVALASILAILEEEGFLVTKAYLEKVEDGNYN